MHLDEAESDLLKKWIIKKLEDISDADSDVLADYVLALAKTDDPETVAKANCVENLKDFLVDNTESFVNELFQVISTKSYDPNRPPPKPTPQVYQPPKRNSAELPQSLGESRKRSYHDWDREEPSQANGHIQSYGGEERPMKQPRRGGRGYEQRGGRPSQQSMQHYGLPSMPQMPTPPPGMPQIDPNNPMASFLAMQQAMGLFQGMPNGGSPPNANGFALPAAQRCRDYDTKGFCAAGASCPYEHGNDPYVVPGLNQDYDPSNSTLLNVTPSRVGHVNVFQNERGKGGPRGRGRGGGNWRGGNKRSDYSHIGPNRDTTITSIVVEQIPKDKCDEQSVRDFFSEFGNIEEVTVEPEKKLAIIKYSSHEAARSAYESPKVVFDNRFVKVYWHKSDKQSDSPQEPAKSRNANSRAQDGDMQDDDQVDPIEVAKRQEEAQRKHDEAKKQREDAVKQKQELDAKLQAMEAERQKMADLLAKKTGKAPSKSAEPPKENGAEESEQTKALKVQLKKLEEEAVSLGIDPDTATNGFNSSASYRGRGGFRGRPRGRGYHPGYRGGWAGAGASRGGAVMRLDNRPKTVAVTFSDGSFDSHDEALRQFLLFNSLDTAALAKHPDREDTALITFNQRFEGENFMATAANTELLHIGKVELAWYKPEDKLAKTNGNHEIDTKTNMTEASGQRASDVLEVLAEDAVDEEDLDRWS